MLPKLGPLETQQLWLNALRWQKKGGLQAKEEAQKILDAIETSWLIRAAGPRDGWFPWPTTEAHPGLGTLGPNQWLEMGLLSFLGYHVGANGEAESVRRLILQRLLFLKVLPPVFPAWYLRQWGEVESAERLKKTADTIASLVRNNRRMADPSRDLAIEHWCCDLTYLHREHYTARFGFAWPDTI